MRNQQRIQGRVAVTAFEVRRNTGRVVVGGGSISSPGQRSWVIGSGDWTADGSLYYVDVTHGLRGVEYTVQINDDHTGEDIMPERINRRIDLDKCRIWLAYTPASCTVIIIQ